jgi:hypothetical protein
VSSGPDFSTIDETAIARLIDEQLIAETHYREFKRELPSGAGPNKELARDVASFAIDGGQLVIGIEEDKPSRRFSSVPQPLDGLRERIENVVGALIDPRLPVTISEIPSVSTSGQGYVVISIQPSALAPHMVDGVYYGRGDVTRIRLSDEEVRRLHDERSRGSDVASDALDRDIERDPTGPELRQEAHLFIVAIPSWSRPEMLHDALLDRAIDGRSWLTQSIVHARPGEYNIGSPDLSQTIGVARRADGWAAFTYCVGPDRQVRANGPHAADESDLLDLEIHEDGSIHLFCGRATDSREEQRWLFLSLVSGLAGRVVRCAEVITELTEYSGPWAFGLAIEGLQGAISWGRGRWMSQAITYTNATYRRTFEAPPGSLSRAESEQNIVEALTGALCRGLGESTPIMTQIIGP